MPIIYQNILESQDSKCLNSINDLFYCKEAINTAIKKASQMERLIILLPADVSSILEIRPTHVNA